MAVGDVVNGISGNNAILTFQPAIGVECLITYINANFGAMAFRLTDGVNSTPGNQTATQPASPSNMKMFVNNALFLQIDAGGAGFYNGFTGLQIK
jgi:hypothetical protein